MNLLPGPASPVQQAAPARDNTVPPGHDLDGQEAGNFSAVRILAPGEMVAPEPPKNTYYVVTVGWRIGIFGDW
jgi:hypothetical protein